MNEFLKSKLFAWTALAVVITLLGITFTMRPVWWSFIDIFFLFMAAFLNVMSVTLKKLYSVVASKLMTCVMIFLVLWVLALIGEWIAFNV